MPIDRPLFEPGDIVKHFKRETVSDLRSNDYLYKIVGEAKHTETDEPLIIYRACMEKETICQTTKNVLQFG